MFSLLWIVLDPLFTVKGDTEKKQSPSTTEMALSLYKTSQKFIWQLLDKLRQVLSSAEAASFAADVFGEAWLFACPCPSQERV